MGIGKTWGNVPDKSTLHVKVEGGTGTVQGKLSVPGGTARELMDEDLRAGETIKLRAPRSCKLILILIYARSSTMTVTATVERPDGKRHGKAFEAPVPGKNGEVKTVEIGATMREEEEV